MLTPGQLDALPQRLIELYAQAEAQIIADMAARLSKMDFIPAAGWQFKKLEEMGFAYDDILAKLSDATKIAKPELERLMKDGGVSAIAADNRVYRQAGLTPPVLSASPALQRILQEGLRTTKATFDNLTRTTAQTATKQFEIALDLAWLEINSGAFSYDDAIRHAVKGLADKGLASITYPPTAKRPLGRTDYLDVAVRRATVTGVNQTALRMQDTLADEMGSDLVDVTAHAGARPSHAIWQGGRYSRSGTNPKYRWLVEATGYGSVSGLGGANCRHSMFPAFEGMEPVYDAQELAGMKEAKYEYNGQKLTEYEASQEQRKIERNIRKWKREYLGMEAAGQPTEEAAARLAGWQREQQKFVKQTGLKRDYSRQAVGGFGREEATKASSQAKRITSQTYVKSSIKQNTTQAAENWASSVLGIKEVNYRGQPIEIVNSVNKSLNKIFKEYPILSGFIDRIGFGDIDAVAQASLAHRNGTIKSMLTFSPTLINDTKTIDSMINSEVKNRYWSPKKGFYGIVKHESAHLVEYAVTLKKYGIYKTGSPPESINTAFAALRQGEISSSIKKKALNACGLKDDSAIIKKRLSEYANKSSHEFLAEAVSEHNPRKLAKETVRILKELLGGY